MYHNNIINPTPYFTSTLKKDALILDLSKTVSSQAAVTTAKPFNKFSDGIIKAFILSAIFYQIFISHRMTALQKL